MQQQLPDHSIIASPQWFCVRSKQKSEHIAARHLREYGFEVFLPRIRFKRITRSVPAWVTEALFPSYLFARFDWSQSFRQARSANGVSTIVHFGDTWPTIPDAAIEELKNLFGTESLREVKPDLTEGDEVTIASGPFQGLLAVVNRVLPAPERIRVLLDFLGRQTSVEIQTDSVMPARNIRATALDDSEES